MPMFRSLAIVAAAAALALACGDARGVTFGSTDDPTFNTTAPDGAYADSGWQFQGTLNGFLATPIAPQYFISAAHIGGAVGSTLQFQEALYLTDAAYAIPGTDLRIWHVTTEFPTYAPLYRSG